MELLIGDGLYGWDRQNLPMVSGTEVGFYRDSETGEQLCRAPIPIALQVAECMTVSCDSALRDAIDVFVKVDPDSLSDECHENNNAALYPNVACGRVFYSV